MIIHGDGYAIDASKILMIEKQEIMLNTPMLPDYYTIVLTFPSSQSTLKFLSRVDTRDEVFDKIKNAMIETKG